jgi:hypothetical protein
MESPSLTVRRYFFKNNWNVPATLLKGQISHQFLKRKKHCANKTLNVVIKLNPNNGLTQKY